MPNGNLEKSEISKRVLIVFVFSVRYSEGLRLHRNVLRFEVHRDNKCEILHFLHLC